MEWCSLSRTRLDAVRWRSLISPQAPASRRSASFLGFCWTLAGLLGLACGDDDLVRPAPAIVFEPLDGGVESAVAATSSAPREADDVRASSPRSSEEVLNSADSQAEVDDDGSRGESSRSERRTEPVAPLPQLESTRTLANGIGLAATRMATTVYKRPHRIAKRLGYIRLGGIVRRAPEPVRGSGCKRPWYKVYPQGYVCGEEGTTDLEDPLVKATAVRPNLSQPLPYRYGFVRATAPQYLRIPTKAEQLKSEFKLEEHLNWYQDNYQSVQRVTLGANDVPLDSRGYPAFGQRGVALRRLSSQLSTTELLGGASPRGQIPFWLNERRRIPNVSGFEVPEYAVFAGRVRRKTGLSFVDAFVAGDVDLERRFAVTVDMRLVPATKVKPDTGSPFHGTKISEEIPLPFAFVVKRGARTWKLFKGRDEAAEDGDVPRRALVPVSGKVRFKAGKRFYQLARNRKRWLRASDIGVVTPPPELPAVAARGEKWIDVSLRQQTLVLYEGSSPVYATLVSTGKDRLGDPKKSLATPQGAFRLKSKHIAAAMDSEENSSVSGGTRSSTRLRLSGAAKATVARVLAAEKAGRKLSGEDRQRLRNIKRGRHPEYGVTMRRGSGNYELRDVPWIQYFAAGYAIHGAYWHDVFGIPRSHGCINLAPIDARIVFMWTDPPVPQGWHGLNVSTDTGIGTLVSVRE